MHSESYWYKPGYPGSEVVSPYLLCKNQSKFFKEIVIIGYP